MAYADIIRSAFPTMEDIADLIEGIASADMPTTLTTYTANPAASGSMTWTSTTTDACEYVRIGKACWVIIKVRGTVGGTLSNNLFVDLPFTARATGGGAALEFPALVASNSALFTPGIGYIGSSATQVGFTLNGGGNWTAGIGGVAANFIYRIA